MSLVVILHEVDVADGRMRGEKVFLTQPLLIKDKGNKP